MCPPGMTLQWIWCIVALAIFVSIAVSPGWVMALMPKGRGQLSSTGLLIFRSVAAFAAVGVVVRVSLLLRCIGQ